MKYDETMMKTALIWAEQSYCKRAKVGSVIAKDGRILSNGYNGTIVGSSNECEYSCDGCNGKGFNEEFDNEYPCKKCQGKGIISNPNVVHAEANAILFAAKNGLSTEDCTIYVTLSPCIECSKMIVQSGIKRVIFGKHYREDAGVKFLENSGITVEFLEV